MTNFISIIKSLQDKDNMQLAQLIQSQTGMESSAKILIIFGAVWFFLVVWSLVWKGFSLWKAAQAKNKYWFIALLLINTAGILDILYIFVFSKKDLFGIKNKNQNN